MVLESPAAFRVGSMPPPSLSPEQMVKAFRRHPDREPDVDRARSRRACSRRGPIVERVLVSTPEYDEALDERGWPSRTCARSCCSASSTA